MYSGTTLHTKSGGILGAHQKIDRVARRHLKALLPVDAAFPTTRQILHFEGDDGPDGVKRKSPGRDEPWHYIDPTDPADAALLDMIDDHVANLTAALKQKNTVRAAFEAAWLAHAIVDGLTPAHHYPLEEKLERLRGGEGLETRDNFRKKVVMPGSTPRERLHNNWEFWGAKGIMTTHLMFEFGVSTTIATRGLHSAKPNANERLRVERDGVRAVFLDAMRHIHHLKMYEVFHKKGWTRALARQTHDELVPTIIRVVTLAWYYAAWDTAPRSKRR